MSLGMEAAPLVAGEGEEAAQHTPNHSQPSLPFLEKQATKYIFR